MFKSIHNALLRLGRVYKNHGIRGVLARFSPDPQLEDKRDREREILQREAPKPKEDYQKALLDLSYTPTISVVMPVYNTPTEFLDEAIQSVVDQVYPHWELCIADDASTDPAVKETLLKWQEKDTRIKVVFCEENGHIARCSQSALELATGEYVALLDHDDLIPYHAFVTIVQDLQDEVQYDLIYTDEAKISENGELSEPTEKPDWSPFYFRGFMYVGHLKVLRRELVNQVGGFRAGFEGSQDYDLLLRVTEKTDKILHIPKILYYWRAHSDSVAGDLDAKHYAFENGLKAHQDAIKRLDDNPFGLEVIPGPYPGTYNYALTQFEYFDCPIGDILNTDFNKEIERAVQASHPFTLLRDSSTPQLTEEQAKHFFAPLAFSFVDIVNPIFVNKERTKVVSAGRMREGEVLSDRLKDHDLSRGASGHLLYVGCEADEPNLAYFALKTELLKDFLNHDGSFLDYCHLKGLSVISSPVADILVTPSIFQT